MVVYFTGEIDIHNSSVDVMKLNTIYSLIQWNLSIKLFKFYENLVLFSYIHNFCTVKFRFYCNNIFI